MEGVFPTYQDVYLTFLRWFVGLSVGTLIGLLAALLDILAVWGASRRINWISHTISIPLDFLRSLPIIALVPIVQMLGVDERWKISLIAWAVMFPIWISVRQSLAKQLIDTEIALYASGLRHSKIFWIYRLPRALGGLIKGIEISIGVAWISVVAAEWVGTYTTGFWAGGLGYKIIKAHDANNWSGMLACLLIFGVLGVATALFWRSLWSTKRRMKYGFNPKYGYTD